MADEREFLHDLSSPLSTSLMLAEITAEGMASGASSEASMDCMAKLSESIRRVCRMLDTRRTLLKGEYHD